MYPSRWRRATAFGEGKRMVVQQSRPSDAVDYEPVGKRKKNDADQINSRGTHRDTHEEEAKSVQTKLHP